MATKKFKPITPGRRFMNAVTNQGLDDVEPEKSLLKTAHKKAGRNNSGAVLTVHCSGYR
jgi:large subunit ribosomal protein L2